MTVSEAQSTTRYTLVLRVLEGQLAELDQIGAHIVAAHVDAAITQIRRDISAISA